MPTIQENLFWGNRYDWSQHGDEWSAAWGDPETQWHTTLLPRIRQFLPASRLLEIAPGFGRWTSFLLQHTEAYIGVDLNAECIDACKERFSRVGHARFVANDGKSLGAAEDRSIDFAFSFDSLVHVEADVIEAYLQDLSRKLNEHGVAFIHHSNLGEYADRDLALARFIDRWGYRVPFAMKGLKQLQLTGWDHWRGVSVTALKVAEAAKAAGLVCIGQELINWSGGRRLIDCLSLFTVPGSKWDRPNVVVRNPHFIAEAHSAQAVSRLYTALRSVQATKR